MAERIVSERGLACFFRAGSMTAVREGIFVASYMGVAPLLKKSIVQRRPETTQATALAASSIVAGSLGAFLSHPADTIKSRLQGSTFDPHRAAGPRAVLWELSLGQCYAGFLPRVFRICCCTFIYGSLSEVLSGYIHEWNSRRPLAIRSSRGFGVVGTASTCEDK